MKTRRRGEHLRLLLVRGEKKHEDAKGKKEESLNRKKPNPVLV